MPETSPAVCNTPVLHANRFYLGHTPRLEPLNCSADQAERRATKRGCSSPSCVSHRLRMADHVAIPDCWEGPLLCSLAFLPTNRLMRTSSSHISGDRTWKHPLTHQQQSFAVWHRLPSNSPASPFPSDSGLSWLSYSPSRFFRAIAGLAGPVSPVTRLKAPHAGQVERSPIARELTNPLDGIRQRSCAAVTRFER